MNTPRKLLAAPEVSSAMLNNRRVDFLREYFCQFEASDLVKLVFKLVAFLTVE